MSDNEEATTATGLTGTTPPAPLIEKQVTDVFASQASVGPSSDAENVDPSAKVSSGSSANSRSQKKKKEEEEKPSGAEGNPAAEPKRDDAEEEAGAETQAVADAEPSPEKEDAATEDTREEPAVDASGDAPMSEAKPEAEEEPDSKSEPEAVQDPEAVVAALTQETMVGHFMVMLRGQKERGEEPNATKKSCRKFLAEALGVSEKPLKKIRDEMVEAVKQALTAFQEETEAATTPKSSRKRKPKSEKSKKKKKDKKSKKEKKEKKEKKKSKKSAKSAKKTRKRTRTEMAREDDALEEDKPRDADGDVEMAEPPSKKRKLNNGDSDAPNDDSDGGNDAPSSGKKKRQPKKGKRRLKITNEEEDGEADDDAKLSTNEEDSEMREAGAEEKEKEKPKRTRKKKSDSKSQPGATKLEKMRKLMKAVGLANPRRYRELKGLSVKEQIATISRLFDEKGVAYTGAALNERAIQQTKKEYDLKKELEELNLQSKALPDSARGRRRSRKAVDYSKFNDMSIPGLEDHEKPDEEDAKAAGDAAEDKAATGGAARQEEVRSDSDEEFNYQEEEGDEESGEGSEAYEPEAYDSDES